MNQGGTADKLYSPLTERMVLSGAFLFFHPFDGSRAKKFFMQEETHHAAGKPMATPERRDPIPLKYLI